MSLVSMSGYIARGLSQLSSISTPLLFTLLLLTRIISFLNKILMMLPNFISCGWSTNVTAPLNVTPHSYILADLGLDKLIYQWQTI